VTAASSYGLQLPKSTLIPQLSLSVNFEAEGDQSGLLLCPPKRIRRASVGFARGASRIRGVKSHQNGQKWEARISKIEKDDKYLCLGTFDTEEAAPRAYDAAPLEHRGPRAITNSPRRRAAGRSRPAV